MKKLIQNILRAFGTFTIWPVNNITILSDEDAIASDWQAVGDDLRNAMRL